MKRRTQKEFFAAITARAKKRRFVLISNALFDNTIIRERASDFCPVCAVAKELGYTGGARINNPEAWDLGEALGFDADFIRNVIKAADGAEGPMRRRLLAACGVTP